jgi:YspA, cpYpsA-related SLOG family
MRILVTGPRQWTSLEALQQGLDQAAGAAWLLYADTVTLVHGGAEGFDQMAAAEGEARGWLVSRREALWRLGGRLDIYAGHKRNQQMVEDGPYDACVAGLMPCIKANCPVPRPHPTHGTMDCAGRALLAGIPLVPVRPW